jgi:hypothetical protein
MVSSWLVLSLMHTKSLIIPSFTVTHLLIQ